MTRPILGGNLNFVEFDLMNGTETIIRTYLPSELYDFNPESTSFDDQNNRYITIGYSPQNEESIIAIDITNGNIDLTYQSLTEEFFGVECSSVSGMNINSLSIDYNVIIYPNPFSDQTFIEYLSEDSYIVTICDLKGKKVQEIKGNRGGKTPICRNSLAPGIYFVYLEENGGVLGKKKLIISD